LHGGGRTRSWSSRHRLARTINAAAPIDSHCIGCDSGAVRYASSAGARILNRLRRENQVFSENLVVNIISEFEDELPGEEGEAPLDSRQAFIELAARAMFNSAVPRSWR
jgi:hypothetical protein